MFCGSISVLGFVYIEMWEDKEGSLFATLLMVFLLFMAILAISSNLPLFYLGWEGIGLTSLFLINFWSERARGVKAALKVFAINKIGDFLIFLALCLLIGHWGIGSFLLFEEYASIIGQGSANLVLTSSFNLLGFLLVLGGGIKSAQFGTHIWLLEAMEAPLGASALMHSSTLVVAGIFLVAKSYSLIVITDSAPLLLAIWGGWTALFASVIALFQYELKIILAYSTISSMGFMYLLLGLGAYWEALYYLVIHAYLKIFLFLLIGALMFHCGGSQDFRFMGGLWYWLMAWGAALLAGSLGLCGIPYLSGYYCKAPLWAQVSYTNLGWGLLLASTLLCSICTLLYMARLGWAILYSTRNGHRSIYRIRPQT